MSAKYEGCLCHKVLHEDTGNAESAAICVVGRIVAVGTAQIDLAILLHFIRNSSVRRIQQADQIEGHTGMDQVGLAPEVGVSVVDQLESDINFCLLIVKAACVVVPQESEVRSNSRGIVSRDCNFICELVIYHFGEVVALR